LASAINPYHWLFIIGALLVVVVLLPRERWADAWRARWALLGAARVNPSRGVS
jgi:branched-chain amino acid transport system permease protein